MSKSSNIDPSIRVINNESPCCCSFPTLVILILIILQFNGRRKHDDCDDREPRQLVDNSILFIIAIFYLTCCNPCKKMGMY